MSDFQSGREEDGVTIGTRSTRLRRRTLAAAIALSTMIFSAFPTRVAAQSGSGVAAIEGNVTDPDNIAISGAMVFIMNIGTGYERIVYTDGRGKYFASAMPVGSYVIDASASGFARVQREI